MGARPLKPTEQRPGCFAESVRVSPKMRERLPKTVALHFTVTEHGAVQDVSIGDAVDPAVAAQLRAALARCDWKPAADARGNPTRARVEMPVRFEAEHTTAAKAAEQTGTAPPVAKR